jgi:hypothetical protein
MVKNTNQAVYSDAAWTIPLKILVAASSNLRLNY